MKTIPYKIIIPIALLLFGFIRIISILNATQEEVSSEKRIKKDSVYQAIDRESITFILGEDKESNNPFYAEAANYYLYNKEGKTDHFVTGCRSLLEVQEYLENYRPENNLPWGMINLVSHGNQWLGLSVKVTPFSKRANADRIHEYIENDSLLQLSEIVIDDETEIFVHACGLGHNKRILQALADVFKGGEQKPKVNASKLFEFYTSVKQDGSIIESERYYAEAKFITYKMGYRPENTVTANLLKNKYPDSEIDFEDAVSREIPRFTGDFYHYTFEVPVKWVIPYPDSASYPDLSTKAKQHKWISEQDEISDVLNRLNIPQNQFNWWFREVHVRNEDGSKSPAVWLKGYCTILCVINPLTEEEDANRILKKPFIPDITDKTYYCSL
jgi:hypothetical protein